MSADERAAISIEVRRGHPTEEEIAAVVAVVSEAYAAELEDLVADDGPRPSAWMQSRRSLRRPLRREVGWGRFSG